MTDYEKLRMELNNEKDYLKNKTLKTLLALTDKKTGKLPTELYIDEDSVGKDFLKEILESLGYNFEYVEDYNPYHERFFYKGRLS